MATKLCITSYPGESSQLCVIAMFVFIFLTALFNRPQFSHYHLIERAWKRLAQAKTHSNSLWDVMRNSVALEIWGDLLYIYRIPICNSNSWYQYIKTIFVNTTDAFI